MSESEEANLDKEGRDKTNGIPLGEFPFPLATGPQESRYLTWIRNHSNYMAVRGLLDYIRAFAVLVRGVIVNILIYLPWLIATSLLISLADKYFPAPFQLTKYSLILAVAWILLLPMLFPFFQIVRLRKSVESGSPSSVKLRDLYERSFGVLLLLIAGVTIIELVQILAELPLPDYISVPQIASVTGGVALAVFGSANKVMSLLGGLAKKVAVLALGVIGFLIPVVIIVIIVRFVPPYIPEEGVVTANIPAGNLVPIAIPEEDVVAAANIPEEDVVAAANIPEEDDVAADTPVSYLSLSLASATSFMVDYMFFVILVRTYREWVLTQQLTQHRKGGLLMILWLGPLFSGAWWKYLWKNLLNFVGLFISLLVSWIALVITLDGSGEEVMFLFNISAFCLFFCWFFVDVNLTSIHGLYRDRLASAFLVGNDDRGDVDIEEDLDLAEICRYEAGSIAPYHLINAALNLQGSKSIEHRDSKSDHFVFTKKFTGGSLTGYCRSENMERVFPQMGLSTAMAISAAAASPNMGRATNPALSFLMAILNIRLGFWVPNPGRLEDKLTGQSWRKKRKEGKSLGLSFEENVFQEELVELSRRWAQLPEGSGARTLSPSNDGYKTEPTIAHSLVGVAFSGGGIRSATLNLGIVQMLEARGVLDHTDYMSTVSGGGYLGSSLSALMRRRTRTHSKLTGTATIVEMENSEFDGFQVTVQESGPSFWKRFLNKIRATPSLPEPRVHKYRYEKFAELSVKNGGTVKTGQRIINTRSLTSENAADSLADRYSWSVPPWALLWEMFGRLNEEGRWVNVSDGGHIENLATIELLRRRCRFIIVGDGEADPKHHFAGMATLIRLARIDLGIKIEINLDPLRLQPKKENNCEQHWALGRIIYPNESTHGYLLYLKSSLTGQEDEVIKQYRNTHESFPHESTADQFFDEGQFEAYRSLGQGIAEQVLGYAEGTRKDQMKTQAAASEEESGNSTVTEQEKLSFKDLEKWFEKLGALSQDETPPSD